MNIFLGIRRALYKMGIIKGASTIFKERDIPSFDGYYSDYIDLWKEIYKGNPPWREVKKSGLTPKGKRKLSTMNTAKVLSQEFSQLTFSEQVEITVSDKAYQEYVEKVLQSNGFWKNFPNFLEIMYAIGGGVLKTYISDSKVKLDYVDADRFIPTMWDNNKMHDGGFLSTSVKNAKYYSLFEWQYKSTKMNDIGETIECIIIENMLFESTTKEEVGIEVPLNVLYPNLQPIYYVENVSNALFSYCKPSMANNKDTDIPLGISIYANALDTIKALDIAFDSFNREFILGRKRIIVPISSIKTVPDKDGNMLRYFDADDEVYQALKVDDVENLKVQDNTLELRVEEHIAAINALLNILCFQTGLSAGTLSFDNVAGLKTATEVISQNSKTYRTKQSHQNIISETIEDTVKNIITLGIALGDLTEVNDYEVVIGFDDSIIVDENAIIDNAIKLVGSGLKSKIMAIMEINKCDEVTAQEELDRINNESQIDGGSIDMANMDSGNTDTSNADVTQTAEEVVGKSLNGAQTQSLMGVLAQYSAKELSLGQAINIVSIAIGISKEEAKKIIEGAE